MTTPPRPAPPPLDVVSDDGSPFCPRTLYLDAQGAAWRMDGSGRPAVYMELSSVADCNGLVALLSPADARKVRDWLSLALEALDP